MTAALLLAGCNRGGAGGPPGGFPPAQVAVMTAQPKTVPMTLEYAGQITGVREVEVRARVTGILLKRNYVEGGPVKAGQSLFTIDPAPFRAALAQAEADLASAQARLAQAQRNSARLKPLIEAKAVAQKDADDALSAEQIAAADVQSAKARLTQARLNLEYSRVEAPISGIAGRALKSEGSLVSGPDVLLTTVSQTKPIYVSFGLPDNEQLRWQRQAQAGELVLPADGKFTVAVKLADGSMAAATGKMNFADVRINPATGTSEARAELPNPDGSLRPGQFVRVLLSGAQRTNAILVPQRAVLDGPQGKFVYVVSDKGTADIRPVEAGDWTGDSWVIRKGLKAADKVIVDGVMKIGPGAPVQIADAAAAAPGAAKPATPSAAGAAPAASAASK
jgi:membrane fusion protein (multidrug efflux system)